MYVAGINTGCTRDGRTKLKDGGACILRDGRVIAAIAEERLTRKVHDGGFQQALQYALETAEITINDLDLIVVSSASEEVLPPDLDIGFAVRNLAKIQVMPSHHLSHAYSAFAMSPFTNAVIMVIDNEGNIIGPRQYIEFWLNQLERSSYFVGDGREIRPLVEADDYFGPGEIGLGETYRYFTYYLGWHSYVYAGKTMGLAPYGQHDTFANVELFDLQDGRIHCRLPNYHTSPLQAIYQFSQREGNEFGPPRSLTDPFTTRYHDIAFLVQDRLEKALIYKAQHLYRLTGLKNLVIAGGVGLNCVANRKILDSTPFENIFIQPAAGDSGQCLGNALYGHMRLLGGDRPEEMRNAYFGRPYSVKEIESSLHKVSDGVIFEAPSDLHTVVAAALADGFVIGWFQEGSEFGPRALGNRSILADPRRPAMQDYLNTRVKYREPFRPYAPSVLAEHASEYFDLPCRSPFMLLTANVCEDKRALVPAITHVDGTSRVQTVTREANGGYYDLISNFYHLTGVPMVLNTSFNLAGEPIVETPMNAIDCFLRSELDYLVIGPYVVRKSVAKPDSGFVRWMHDGYAV